MAHVLARVFDLRSPPPLPPSIHLCDCSAILSDVSDQIKSFANGNASMHAVALPLGGRESRLLSQIHSLIVIRIGCFGFLHHPRRRLHSMLYESFAQSTTRSTSALNKGRRRTIDTPRERRAMPVLDIFSMNHSWNPPPPIVRGLLIKGAIPPLIVDFVSPQILPLECLSNIMARVLARVFDLRSPLFDSLVRFCQLCLTRLRAFRMATSPCMC
ncbi:hypothetical protein CDAR_227501 [Caerostris darwini]|uniref:Uncharacterized protein n=1 Tax=Caerostris darwini TaxID=1538125 RepID=A0AAV4UM69_9ARAC|nr:hypothetical protein CDAR_227501 [Caerostris darwini]